MIYFDNSATTKPYKEVLETFVKVNERFFGNPSSLHQHGMQAERLILESRKQLADQLNVKPDEIVFTSGGTESNNLAIKGAALYYKNRGKHILAASSEHPSVINACKQLEGLGYRVDYLPVDAKGRVSVQDIKTALTDETILVTVMHVNNEVGTIQPIKEIGQLLKKYPKVLFHVDDVQGRGKVPLDLKECHVDLCSISAHKFHGLKGTGLLYKKSGVEISPLLSGGNQESNLRSGTENTGGIAAMAKALRISEERRIHSIDEMKEIQQYLRSNLTNQGNVVHTPDTDCAPHILNFSVPGVKGEVLVHALEERDIYVSTTSACSSKQNKPSTVLMAMGISLEEASSSIRLSLTYENTIDEAQMFIHHIKEVVPKITKVQR
ncbi:cysteine desulfurase [Bacillus ectoiniformans]|uniref:cysteine desulfurase family protein n=1 Tax=Bacillus ectoiniformans TaxID=1494429 RepID=UPI00195EBCC7|nr:cysteine desulfurase family protein [Bacillus ectoiniformans]MBM7648809.1 cysteine desulfurase [Bacillus ectoiniformans]